MTSDKKFGLLRRLLRALGLTRESTDEVVEWIVDLRSDQNGVKLPISEGSEFPYHLRNNFLTLAELSFFNVLRTSIEDRAVLCTKDSLGDVFWVPKEDPSKYRIYTNKIDRKHIDFLLCDVVTMRPLVGIELDDKSHQRADRRARDEYVDQVFAAAKLPLLHIPVKRAYDVAELRTLLAPYLASEVDKPVSVPVVENPPLPFPSVEPLCPKCGNAMVLRTAKSGANAGNRFWGCSNYPTCRSILPHMGA